MKKETRVCGKWIAIFPIVVLCGCTSTVLRHDYVDYSEMYGDSNNKQLLMNLARESNDEPAYFIQLGTINSGYQFTTSAGFAPSSTTIAHPGGLAANIIQHSLTLGGNLNAGATENPQFQFLPLNGSNYAEAISSPISTDVFMKFYDQGYPADLLARTMVASIQKEMVQTNIIETTNVVVTTNYVFYINDPLDPSYPKFLAYCDYLHKAQLTRTLIVQTASKDGSAVYTYKKNSNVKLGDVSSAIAAGLSVKYDATNDDFIVTHPKESTGFAANHVTNSINYGVTYKIIGGGSQNQMAGDGATNKNGVLKIEQVPVQVKSEELFIKSQALAERHVTLKMRTFEAVMYCVAREDAYYKELEKRPASLYSSTNIFFTNDAYGAFAIVTRTNSTKFFTRPILRIQYSDAERLNLSKLADVTYRNKTYTVGDIVDRDMPGQSSRTNHLMDVEYPANYPETNNRLVFTMVSYLFSQIAIDTTKLPVQQLIQVQ